MAEQRAKLSSPFSTGGGGVNFEVYVQTYIAMHIATGDFLPFLSSSKPVKMKLQGHYDGYNTDDCIIFGEKGEKILCQIKHSIIVSENDPVFHAVITDAWNDYCNSDKFNRKTDRIILVVSSLSKTDADHTKVLFEWARCCENADEFINKITTGGFSSTEKAKKYNAIKTALESAKGGGVTDFEILDFLRHFNIQALELDHIKSPLFAAVSNSFSRAVGRSGLESTLYRYVAEYNQNAGTITRDRLLNDLKIRTHDSNFEILNYCEQIWSACQKRYEDIRKPGNRFDWDIIETLLPNGLVNGADFECLGKKGDEKPRPMLDIVESTDSNIAIIGEGGIGKTTFLRKILASTLRDENDDPKPYDPMESIPIFIELHRCPSAIANWKDPDQNKTNFITRYIAQILENHNSLHLVSSKNLELIEKLMQGIPEKGQKPRFLLLLDGFNEVQSSKEIDVRSYLSNELSVLSGEEYKGVRILTTSRPTETAYYARKFENIPAVGQQPDVICKFLEDTGKTETEISIIKENKALMHILSVPLYLCMFSAVVSMSILVNPEIIPILSGFHSGIIRTRKRPALVLISDTKLLCKNDYKTISAA